MNEVKMKLINIIIKISKIDLSLNADVNIIVYSILELNGASVLSSGRKLMFHVSCWEVSILTDLVRSHNYCSSAARSGEINNPKGSLHSHFTALLHYDVFIQNNSNELNSSEYVTESCGGPGPVMMKVQLSDNLPGHSSFDYDGILVNSSNVQEYFLFLEDITNWTCSSSSINLEQQSDVGSYLTLTVENFQRIIPSGSSKPTALMRVLLVSPGDPLTLERLSIGCLRVALRCKQMVMLYIAEGCFCIINLYKIHSGNKLQCLKRMVMLCITKGCFCIANLYKIHSCYEHSCYQIKLNLTTQSSQDLMMSTNLHLHVYPVLTEEISPLLITFWPGSNNSHWRRRAFNDPGIDIGNSFCLKTIGVMMRLTCDGPAPGITPGPRPGLILHQFNEVTGGPSLTFVSHHLDTASVSDKFKYLILITFINLDVRSAEGEERLTQFWDGPRWVDSDTDRKWATSTEPQQPSYSATHSPKSSSIRIVTAGSYNWEKSRKKHKEVVHQETLSSEVFIVTYHLKHIVNNVMPIKPPSH